MNDLAKFGLGAAVATACIVVIAYASKPLFHAANLNPAVEIRTVSWDRANAKVQNLTGKPGAYVLRGAPTPDKVVALTFDDGPREDTTEKLIKVLKQESVPATFFVIGNRVESYPSIVRDIDLNGFELGNHTYSHINLKSVEFDEMMTEYEATNEAVEGIVGHGMRFCRPPGGDNNFDTERAGATVGLKTVLWTDDPNDYVRPGQKAIMDYTLEHLTPGGIILLHDGVNQTIEVLPKLIHEIWKKGDRIVPLDQLPAGKV